MKSLSEEAKKISEKEYEELFKNRRKVESKELSADELESVSGGYLTTEASAWTYIYECGVEGCSSFNTTSTDLGSSTNEYACPDHPGIPFIKAYYVPIITPGVKI